MKKKKLGSTGIEVPVVMLGGNVFGWTVDEADSFRLLDAAFLARFRKYLRRVEQAMGALLVLTGIAFLTGSLNQMSVWLLEAFPVLGKIG